MTLTDQKNWQQVNADYHADFAHDSHSSLQLFRESRERYKAVRIDRTLEMEEQTPAMAFGSLFHCLVLENAAFADAFAVCPNSDRRTKAGKEAWEIFCASNDGKTFCTDEDLSRAKAMREGVMRNKHARQALEAPGVNEQPVYWVDAKTGLLLKCKPDRLLESQMVVDLKTTDDISPEGFSRSVFKWSYHKQAALYCAGLFDKGMECPFLFIAVSKDAPHECVCHLLDERVLSFGRDDNESKLQELAECKKTGDFSGRWSHDIQTVELPRWYSNKVT